MTVHLTPELEKLVASKIESGEYNTVSEVVRDALYLLARRDEASALRKGDIRTLIDEGWEAARRGELVDGDNAFDRIDAELEAMERSAPK
ncbi:conserved hypothetical protein [Candidatus Sulfopaludibacter sp. SbA4]|nr:conserved hypothetical protein [Candidatus Sulfopaludibacter sp. SbA4]